MDYIDDSDLNGCKRFRDGGECSVELIAPKVILDLLPEWESKDWWELDVVIDHGEGIFESEREVLDEYGVKNVDEINAHFARGFMTSH